MKNNASLVRTFLMASSLTLCGVEAFGSICNVINPAEISFDQSSLNFDSIQNVYVSDGDIIKLETCEGSLISDIKNLFTIDNNLYVHTHNSLHVFDNNGAYRFDISEGQSGEEDEDTISNVYERNGSLYIDNGSELSCFSSNGELLSSHFFNDTSSGGDSLPVHPYPLKKGPNISDDIYTRYADINNNTVHISGIPDNYQICDSLLYFTYQISTAKTCLCQYNPSSRQSRLYHFITSNSNQIQRSFFKIIDGMAYIEFRNEDNSQNPSLIRVRLSDL